MRITNERLREALPDTQWEALLIADLLDARHKLEKAEEAYRAAEWNVNGLAQQYERVVQAAREIASGCYCTRAAVCGNCESIVDLFKALAALDAQLRSDRERCHGIFSD